MFAFHFLSSFNLAFAVPFFFKRAPVWERARSNVFHAWHQFRGFCHT
jgi:hypothetical protein